MPFKETLKTLELLQECVQPSIEFDGAAHAAFSITTIIPTITGTARIAVITLTIAFPVRDWP
jgi:hypothetical protein